MLGEECIANFSKACKHSSTHYGGHDLRLGVWWGGGVLKNKKTHLENPLPLSLLGKSKSASLPTESAYREW